MCMQDSLDNVFESSTWALRSNNNRPFKLSERRRFSRSRNYVNTTATFAFNLIQLAGDVELNPGMNESTSQAKKKGLQRNLQIAHLNTRSIKNREHLSLFSQENWLLGRISTFLLSRRPG